MENGETSQLSVWADTCDVCANTAKRFGHKCVSSCTSLPLPPSFSPFLHPATGVVLEVEAPSGNNHTQHQILLSRYLIYH